MPQDRTCAKSGSSRQRLYIAGTSSAVRHALARRDLEKAARLERGHQHGAAADVQHRQNDRHEAGDVGGRHRQHRHFAVAERHAVLVVHQRMHNAEMGEHRALRAAGGARGVEQREDVLLGDGRVRRRRRRHQLGERRARPLTDHETFAQMRQRGAIRQMLGKIALIDQPRGLALRQDEFGLGLALADAHRHHDDAGARAGSTA